MFQEPRKKNLEKLSSIYQVNFSETVPFFPRNRLRITARMGLLLLTGIILDRIAVAVVVAMMGLLLLLQSWDCCC